MSLLDKIKEWLSDHMTPITPPTPPTPVHPTNANVKEDEEKCKNKQ